MGRTCDIAVLKRNGVLVYALQGTDTLSGLIPPEAGLYPERGRRLLLVSPPVRLLGCLHGLPLLPAADRALDGDRGGLLLWVAHIPYIGLCTLEDRVAGNQKLGMRVRTMTRFKN